MWCSVVSWEHFCDLFIHGKYFCASLLHRSTSVLHCFMGALLCSVASREHFCAPLLQGSTSVLHCFVGALLCSVALWEHICAPLLCGSTSVLHCFKGALLCSILSWEHLCLCVWLRPSRPRSPAQKSIHSI